MGDAPVRRSLKQLIKWFVFRMPAVGLLISLMILELALSSPSFKVRAQAASDRSGMDEAIRLNNEAMQKARQGSEAEAMSLMRQAIALADRSFPIEHTTPIGMRINAHAIAKGLKDDRAAEQFARDAIRLGTRFQPFFVDIESSIAAMQAADTGDYETATKKFEIALQATDNFVGMFTALRPSHADRAQIEANVAQLLGSIGNTYLRLAGQQRDVDRIPHRQAAEAAEKHLVRAVALVKGTATPDPERLRALLTDLGIVYHRMLNKLPEAASSLEQALGLAKKLLGPMDVKLGGAHSNISQLYDDLGQLDKATEHCDAALRILTPARDKVGRLYFHRTARDCGKTFTKSRDDARYARVQRDALEAIDVDLRKCDQEAFTQGRGWVENLRGRAQYDAAKDLLAKIASASKGCRGTNYDPDRGRGTGAGRLAGLGQKLAAVILPPAHAEERPARGTASFRSRLAAIRDTIELANLNYEQSKAEDALKLLNEARDMLSALVRPDDPAWLEYYEIALIHAVHHDRERTFALIADARRVLEHNRIEGHGIETTINIRLGSFKYVDGDFAGAIVDLEAALAGKTDAGTVGNIRRSLALNLIWLARETTDRAARQQYLARAAREIAEIKKQWAGNYTMDHPDYIWLREAEAELAEVEGNSRAALAQQQTSLDEAERKFGRSHHISMDAMKRLAEIHNRLKQPEKAWDLYLKYVGPSAELYGSVSIEHARHLAKLGYYSLKTDDVGFGYTFSAQALDAYYEVATRSAGFGRAASIDRKEVRKVADQLLTATAAALRRRMFDETPKAEKLPDGREIHVITPASFGDPLQRAFWVTQMTTTTLAAGSIYQMAARLSEGATPAARLIREGQDVVAKLEAARRDLHAVANKPAALAVDSLKQLQARVVELDQLVEAKRTEIKRQNPKLDEFVRAAPLGVNEAVRLLREMDAKCRARAGATAEFCKHAIVLVHSTTAGHVVWVATADKFDAAMGDYAAESVAQDVEALQCGLDIGQWRDPSNWLADTPEHRLAREDQRSRRERCIALLGAEAGPTWTASGTLTRLPSFPQHIAHRLYEQIFSPFEAQIRDKHLIIVPDGALHNLAFNALMFEKPTGHPVNDAKSRAWLGLRQPITILPTLSSLRALQAIAKSSGGGTAYLGVGNPLLDGPDSSFADRAKLARHWTTCKLGSGANSKTEAARAVDPRLPSSMLRAASGDRALDPKGLRRWTPLPETVGELCAVGSLLGAGDADIWLADTANEGHLHKASLDRKLVQYRVLHFATHGALPGDVGGSLEPGLLLTPPSPGAEVDARNDGFLSASEIATLELDADWVILSACNTSAAISKGGEALSGLARSFFYAGARTLLVSHWEVFSEATVRLLSSMFRRGAENAGVARAEMLRLAMREIAGSADKRSAHPASWAAFSAVGKGWEAVGH
ncbi:MAG: hypothetical protein CTY20_04325 [Hyphomicrobium sp.]|nr:MAG: hypothetical protein CTY20_04325 [Hyphomicrobium sp.]